ncbi:MAG: LPS assembly lipoprotein LptE [Pseudomonadota bacterium]
MRSPNYKPIVLLAAVLFISACGFKLKGPIELPPDLSPLYIHSLNADAMAAAVVQALTEQEIELTANQSEAKVGLILEDERVDRRVLSVSAASGRLAEIELNHRVELFVLRPDGSVLLDRQVISQVRDLTFDETAVLAKGAEEAALLEDLQREVLSQILRVVDSLAHQSTASESG